MKHSTTLKTGNLGNSSFLPETTEMCYKNVSNVSRNPGGQAVHFVRPNESCPGKTAKVWYKASEITKKIPIHRGARCSFPLQKEPCWTVNPSSNFPGKRAKIRLISQVGVTPEEGHTGFLIHLTSAVCVCVCFLPIHSGHQVRWTYQPGSHRRKVTQDF